MFMNDIKKIYIRANEQIEDIMDEKQTIFEELIYFVFSFYLKFSESTYFLELIKYVYNYYIEVITEINREHEICESIKKLIYDLENDEIKHLAENKLLLSELSDILDSLNELSEIRMLTHASIYNYFFNLLKSPFLTNSSYKTIKHKDCLTNKVKEKYLSIIKTANLECTKK